MKYILLFFVLLLIFYCTRYSLFEKYSNKFNKKIFIFWDKGWDNIPYLCKVCLQSWKYFNKNWEIVKLDKKNIYDYLDENLLKKVCKIKLVQHQADIIRVNLLKKYGGVWVDATVFCNKPLDEWLFNYMNKGFFCFKFNEESGLHHYKLSNWFLASTKNNYIINNFTKKYNNHWEDITQDNYFGFHFLFNNLCKIDKKFNNNYKNIKFFDSRKIRVQEKNFNNNIEFNLSKPVTIEIKKILDDNSIPMYKFSYQKNKDFNFKTNSTLNYMVNTKLIKKF